MSAVAPSRFKSDFAPLLQDLGFENSVLHRMTVSMIARDVTNQLADEAERILGLVEDDLQ